MGSSKRRAPITREHVLRLEEVIVWCKSQEAAGIDPLMIGVLEDVRDRVAARAKNAAIFRVRLMNHPNPRNVAVATTKHNRDVIWTTEELDMLRDLYYRNVPIADISLAISERYYPRSENACHRKAANLGFSRPRLSPRFDARPVSLIRQRMIEKRQASKQQRLEGVG